MRRLIGEHPIRESVINTHQALVGEMNDRGNGSLGAEKIAPAEFQTGASKQGLGYIHDLEGPGGQLWRGAPGVAARDARPFERQNGDAVPYRDRNLPDRLRDRGRERFSFDEHQLIQFKLSLG